MGPVSATAVVDFVTVVFVLATMLSMGLALTTDEILASLRQRRLMAKSLLGNVVLVPLFAYAFVLAVRARYASVATRLHPPIQRLSTLLLVLLIVLLTIVYAGEMRQLVGTGTLLVSLAVVVGSLLLGYALGGPATATREVLATTTAARNVAVVLLVATTSFRDPGVLTIVVAFGLVSLVVSGPVARLWGRRAEA